MGKFEDHVDIKKTKKIKDYFGAGTSKVDTQKPKELKQNKEIKNTNKNYDKEYIMRKFFQITDKTNEVNPKAVSIKAEDNPKIVEPQTCVEKVLESDLEKQESFFAKLLSKKIDSDTRSIDSDSSLLTVVKPLTKPTTPVCEIVNCGDDSNDTNYSSSTINEEINKSIALFDDDLQAVERVTDMRKILNSKMVRTENELDTESVENVTPGYKTAAVTASNIQTESINGMEIDCPECGKVIPVGMVETHADYHLALQLRDEERLKIRAEIREKKLTTPDIKKKGKRPEENVSRNDSVASIESFLVKLDNNKPTETCSECGKKVSMEKFPEHSDYHEAQRLSRELNKRPTPLVSTDVNRKVNVSSCSKRKRKSTSPAKKHKMPKCKSIDSFFKIT